MRAKGKTEENNLSANVKVRITEDLDHRLSKAAFNLDIAKMDIVRHAIRAVVEEIERCDYRVEWPPVVSFQNTRLEAIRSLVQEELFRRGVGKIAFHEEVLRAAEDESPYPAPRKSTPPVHPPTQRP